MDKITQVTGTAVPLTRSNVDTDQIIPAVFLKRVTKTGFDDALFHAWRKDPDFVLNQPGVRRDDRRVDPLRRARLRHRFEPRARRLGAARLRLQGRDLDPRFGDIFRGNSGKQGLLTGTVSEAELEKFWAAIDAQPGISATVDLVARTVAIGDLELPFEIDDYTRWRLLEGLDDIGLTLRDEARITEFEARRESWRPKTLPVR